MVEDCAGENPEAVTNNGGYTQQEGGFKLDCVHVPFVSAGMRHGNIGCANVYRGFVLKEFANSTESSNIKKSRNMIYNSSAWAYNE